MYPSLSPLLPLLARSCLRLPSPIPSSFTEPLSNGPLTMVLGIPSSPGITRTHAKCPTIFVLFWFPGLFPHDPLLTCCLPPSSPPPPPPNSLCPRSFSVARVFLSSSCALPTTATMPHGDVLAPHTHTHTAAAPNRMRLFFVVVVVVVVVVCIVAAFFAVLAIASLARL